MASDHVLSIDLADVHREPDRRTEVLTTIAWGDTVDVDLAGSTDTALKVNTTWFNEQPDGSITPRVTSGYIVPSRSSGLKPMDLVMERAASKVLKVNFIDVQQGDGSVIETPDGKVILIDGGDNQLFARYLANRFRGTSVANPKTIDAIVVTHGDADHFAGLTEISESETNKTFQKRLFINPRRVFHNGLVKRPGKMNGHNVREGDSFGTTAITAGGDLVITDLVDDLLSVPDAQMNEPFREWKRALQSWNSRYQPIEFKRLQFGDDDAFAFLSGEGLDVSVLGPFPVSVNGTAALPFLHNPPPGPFVRDEETLSGSRPGSISASHTINGHSIVLQLTYGRFRFLFAGDLNDEAELELVKRHEAGAIDLRAELFKVPHHGSADFSSAFLNAVSPVISVVSSGDESARKEYIHPRATLMGALGRSSRVLEPLIFVTELVAFFKMEGRTVPEAHEIENGQIIDLPPSKQKSAFFAFSRTAYGAVKVRTDGERLLVYTNSGQKDLKEAYAIKLEPPANGAPGEVVIVPVIGV